MSDGRERLKAAIGRAAPAVWDWDTKTRTFLASEGLLALYGVDPSAPFGLENYIAHTHAEDRGVWRELFDGVSAGPGIRRILYRTLPDPSRLACWHAADIEISESADGALSLTGTVRDVTSERDARRALIESGERLRLAMEAGRLAIYEIDLTSGRLTGSAELNRLYGLPPDARPTLADLRSHYAPGELERLAKEGATYERARDIERVEAAARGRDPASEAADPTKVEAEVTIVTPAGVTKHLDYRAQYTAGVDGAGARLIGVLVDVSDRKRAEDRLAVIASELHHRMRNLLAIVHAMAWQTFRAEEGSRPSLESFLGRLQALGSATDTLLRENSDDVSLEDIVRQVLEPYRAPQSDPFEICGEPLRVTAKLATSIAMALHELSTNAVKYGALSTPEGRISLAWQVSDDGLLELRWQERGGPKVAPPSRRGFGSRLLSTLIPYGSITQDFAPGGVVCVIRCGLDPADR